MKKHLVLITTWFPPINGVAVNRMEAFAKYFDKDKFDVSVITLKKEEATKSEEIIDGANIYRLPNASLFKLAEFNKGHSRLMHYGKVIWNYFVRAVSNYPLQNWMNAVHQKLNALNSNKRIDIIITSSSPIESHIAAFKFLDKHSQVKWIADCRDELSLNPHQDEKAKMLNESIEKYINQRASILTTVSKPIANDFSKLCPNVQVHEIRNGHNLSLPSDSEYHFNDVFTIVYAGTFYGLRKPHNFFKALLEFVKFDEFNRKVHVKFIGTPRNFDIPVHNNITVEFIEQCTYHEACQYQLNADANLLILPKLEAKGVYSGKLFDYLACCKPIIAVIDPTDVAAELIRDCDAGYIADFDNIQQIETAIYAAYQDWNTKTMLNCNRKKIEKLHRKYQVEKLNQLIDSL